MASARGSTMTGNSRKVSEAKSLELCTRVYFSVPAEIADLNTISEAATWPWTVRWKLLVRNAIGQIHYCAAALDMAAGKMGHQLRQIYNSSR